MYPETTEKELLNLWELINVAPKNEGLKNGDFVTVLLSYSLLGYFYPVLTKLLENSIIGEGLIKEVNVLFYDYSKKSYISESQTNIFEAKLFMSQKMMEVPEIKFKINLKKLKEYFYFLLDQFESNELDFQDVPQIKEFLFQRASVVKVLESTLKENFARNNISFSYEFFTDKNFAPLAVLFCLEKKGFIKIIKLTSDNKAKYLIRVALQDSFDNLLESINEKYGFKKQEALEREDNRMNGERGIKKVDTNSLGSLSFDKEDGFFSFNGETCQINKKGKGNEKSLEYEVSKLLYEQSVDSEKPQAWDEIYENIYNEDPPIQKIKIDKMQKRIVDAISRINKKTQSSFGIDVIIKEQGGFKKLGPKK